MASPGSSSSRRPGSKMNIAGGSRGRPPAGQPRGSRAPSAPVCACGSCAACPHTPAGRRGAPIEGCPLHPGARERRGGRDERQGHTRAQGGGRRAASAALRREALLPQLRLCVLVGAGHTGQLGARLPPRAPTLGGPRRGATGGAPTRDQSVVENDVGRLHQLHGAQGQQARVAWPRAHQVHRAQLLLLPWGGGAALCRRRQPPLAQQGQEVVRRGGAGLVPGSPCVGGAAGWRQAQWPQRCASQVLAPHGLDRPCHWRGGGAGSHGAAVQVHRVLGSKEARNWGARKARSGGLIKRSEGYTTMGVCQIDGWGPERAEEGQRRRRRSTACNCMHGAA